MRKVISTEKKLTGNNALMAGKEFEEIRAYHGPHRKVYTWKLFANSYILAKIKGDKSFSNIQVFYKNVGKGKQILQHEKMLSGRQAV